MRRRKFIGLIGAALVARLTESQTTFAQGTLKLPWIGLLWPGGPPDKWDEAFREGLRTHGYVDGQNILLEYRPTTDIRWGIPVKSIGPLASLSNEKRNGLSLVAPDHVVLEVGTGSGYQAATMHQAAAA